MCQDLAQGSAYRRQVSKVRVPVHFSFVKVYEPVRSFDRRLSQERAGAHSSQICRGGSAGQICGPLLRRELPIKSSGRRTRLSKPSRS